MAKRTDDMNAANNRHVQAFRKRERRIDYYPAPNALAAISKLQAHKPTFNMRQLIDMLVIQGCNACFPESSNPKVTIRLR